jgi:hypothetical protein
MRRIYAILGWGIVALGFVHMAATFRVHSSTVAAIWFFSGGVALVLTGAINLLNRAYGSAAQGLRYVCIATTAGMTVFSFVSGRATHARGSVLVVVVGWFAVTSVLSSLRGALGGVRES